MKELATFLRFTASQTNFILQRILQEWIGKVVKLTSKGRKKVSRTGKSRARIPPFRKPA